MSHIFLDRPDLDYHSEEDQQTAYQAAYERVSSEHDVSEYKQFIFLSLENPSRNVLRRQPGGSVIFDLNQMGKNEFEVSLLGITEDWAWVQFNYGGELQRGYVEADLVSQLLNEVEVKTYRIINNRSAVKVSAGTGFYQSEGEGKIKTLEFGDEVFVVDVMPNDWAKVIHDQQEGYVNVTHLATNTPMPGTGAKLYKIKAGESVEQLVNRYFMTGDDQEDRRFYANVLLYVNNPTNLENRGIVVRDQFDLLESLTINYDRFHLNEGYLIWIPTKIYADSLKDKVNSGSYRKELKNQIDAFSSVVGEKVDEWWPEGFGVYYGAEVGATFAIPIGADVKMETFFYRKNKDTIALRKYDKIAVGLDTGISAGFHIGNSTGKKGGTTFGAQAGANAEVKRYGLGMAEFEFPIHNEGILSALFAISGMNNSMVGQAATLFLDAFAGSQLNPMHYVTKQKLAMGIHAQGNANVSVGLKQASNEKGADAFVSKGSHADERMADNFGGRWVDMILPSKGKTRKQTFKDILKKSANIGVDVLLSGDLSAGVEWERKLKEEEGQMVPEKEVMTVNCEIGVAAMAKADLSILGRWGPIFQRGFGMKFIFDSSKEDYETVLYTVTGDFDLYEGAASETELLGGKSPVDAIKDIGSLNFERIFDLIRHLKYKKRIHLLNWMPGSFKANVARAKQEEKQALTKNDYKENFYNFDAYLEFELDFGQLEESVINDLKRFVQVKFLPFVGENAETALLEFIQWMDKGESSELNKFFLKPENNELDLFNYGNVLPSMIVHAKLGAGVAAGANLSFGAKVKLFGDVHGGLMYQVDVRDAFISKFESLLGLILARNFSTSDIPDRMCELFEGEMFN
ncbi:hypothetical protein [Persicobacter diffluens]|uniref:SH3 domain-containing protein n=1 Tax=Persicobacter diffluens TaxID=981 RepID=A0AAN5AP62_9BACT|nr:hypothetical protein PEDI_45680 [Persicobacter diffluens]